MSGLLDDLRRKPGVQYGDYYDALDDVREALRSDETVRAVLTETGWPETDVNARDVRAVLAALAGDDHE